MGSRLEPRRFLLDFFFLAMVVELPCADEALDCCGLAVIEAAFAGCADVAHAYASDASNSDAAMESLVIFLRFSSLPGAAGFRDRCVRPGCIPIMAIFRAGSSWDISCGAYRATGAQRAGPAPISRSWAFSPNPRS